MDVLDVVVGSVTRTEYYGWIRSRTREHTAALHEWTIDGTSLREIVGGRTSRSGDIPSHIPPFREDSAWPSIAVDNLRQLLGESPGEAEGRVPLLYCPVCADLGCGALTTNLLVTDGFVEWQDLAWQAEAMLDDPPFDPGAAGSDPPLTFRFERGAYEATLRPMLERYTAMSASSG